jgi:hypothetical protein
VSLVRLKQPITKGGFGGAPSQAGDAPFSRESLHSRGGSVAAIAVTLAASLVDRAGHTSAPAPAPAPTSASPSAPSRPRQAAAAAQVGWTTCPPRTHAGVDVDWDLSYELVHHVDGFLKWARTLSPRGKRCC